LLIFFELYESDLIKFKNDVNVKSYYESRHPQNNFSLTSFLNFFKLNEIQIIEKK